MKTIKKIPVFLLTMIIVIGMMAMPAFATSMSQDGLKVTLTTDKESYNYGEQIIATLTVKNTNDFAVSNVSLENMVPEGYKPADNTSMKKHVDVLGPGEITKLAVTVVPEGYKPVNNTSTEKHVDVLGPGEIAELAANKNTPDNGGEAENMKTLVIKDKGTSHPSTGDKSRLTPWLMLMIAAVISVIIIAVLNRKHGRKLFSLFLSIVMAGTIFVNLSAPAKASEPDIKTITIETQVQTGSKSVALKGIVKYDLSEDKAEEKSLKLTGNEHELSATDAERELYFYAEGNSEFISVELFDSNGNLLSEMLDDGLYSKSGDDLPNDNIYSAKISIDASSEGTLGFYAVAKAKDNTEICSDGFEVHIYGEFTDKELDSMDAVDNAIIELTESEEFRGMSEQERAEAAEKLLKEQAELGNVILESVYYDEMNHLYTFSYTCGVLGGIMLKDFDELENSTEDGSIAEITGKDGSSSGPAEETESTAGSGTEDTKESGIHTADSDNNPETAKRNEPESGHTLKNSITKSALTENNVSNQVENIGNAIICYAFDNFTSSVRAPFYKALQSDWNGKGLTTTIDTDVTVNDLKSLNAYKVIVISTHGSCYTRRHGFLWLNKETYPTICLIERTTRDKNKLYSADLKAHRVLKVNDNYWIRPSFFSTHYNGSLGLLNDKFVFSESCEFMGQFGNVDRSMANAFVNSGAEAVVGYHNSVYAKYSREVMKRYFDEMMEGKTATEALNEATGAYGATDVVWANNIHLQHPHANAAYPILSGSGAAKLFHSDIRNGDFEVASTPAYWKTVGDAGVICGLGDIIPSKGSRMALLTTGIGSKESIYQSEAEGSVLSQKVKMSSDVSTLTFSYDVVSEEPMEYIGSEYDDKFIFKILDAGNNEVYNNVYESVNKSNWKSIDSIYFEGGDSTVYHTTWKTVSVDVSKYRGKTVTFQFIVTDVGDSNFDTAAVIDNVYLK